MRALIIATMAPVLAIMAVLDALFLYRMYRQYKNNGRKVIPLLVGILCIGLFYDALILSLGALLKYGPVFKMLSQLRYVLHCTMIPLLFPICCYTFESPKLVKPVWGVTIAVMILGLAAGICTKIEPRTVGAVARYAVSDTNPAWVDGIQQVLDIFPVFLMIGLGLVIWKKKKNANLCLAGAFMLLFTMLGIFLGKDPGGDKTQSLMFYISMFGESLMVYYLWRFSERSRESEAE